MFLETYSFLLGCPICRHMTVHSILLQFFVFLWCYLLLYFSSFISYFIWVLSIFLLMSLTKGLLIFFNLFQNPVLFFFLIFLKLYFIYFLIIALFLLTWGFICFCFVLFCFGCTYSMQKFLDQGVNPSNSSNNKLQQ